MTLCQGQHLRLPMGCSTRSNAVHLKPKALHAARSESGIGDASEFPGRYTQCCWSPPVPLECRRLPHLHRSLLYNFALLSEGMAQRVCLLGLAALCYYSSSSSSSYHHHYYCYYYYYYYYYLYFVFLLVSLLYTYCCRYKLEGQVLTACGDERAEFREQVGCSYERKQRVQGLGLGVRG